MSPSPPLLEKPAACPGEESMPGSAERRKRLLAATGLAAERMLNSRFEPQSFYDALKLLGEAARVSRVYLFQIERHPEGRTLASQRFEWRAPGIAPQISNPAPRQCPVAEIEFDRWLVELDAGRSIQACVDAFPNSERTRLASASIRSLVVVPVETGGRLWGFLGFDTALSRRCGPRMRSNACAYRQG